MNRQSLVWRREREGLRGFVRLVSRIFLRRALVGEPQVRDQALSRLRWRSFLHHLRTPGKPMKTHIILAKTTLPITAARLGAAAKTLLPFLLLLVLPAGVQGQFDYTINNGVVTITRYSGPGG